MQIRAQKSTNGGPLYTPVRPNRERGSLRLWGTDILNAPVFKFLFCTRTLQRSGSEHPVALNPVELLNADG